MRSNVFEFLRFSLVGVLNTVIHYVVFLFLLRVLSVNYFFSSGIGYLAGLTNSYLMNRKFTFRVSHEKSLGEAGRFLVVNAAALGVNLGAMRILVGNVGIIPEIAQVLAIAVSYATNFLGNKFWTFR